MKLKEDALERRSEARKNSTKAAAKIMEIEAQKKAQHQLENEIKKAVNRRS